ncbi:MAG: arginine--tRNA ligase [Treponemataceae bacterium]
MNEIKNSLRELIAQVLKHLKKDKSLQLDDFFKNDIITENPPKPDLGDVGIPLFSFAKLFRLSPMHIAKEVQSILNDENLPFFDQAKLLGNFIAEGPYLNVQLKKTSIINQILSDIHTQKEMYGSLSTEGKSLIENSRVMIEFSSPNTNKPLHLGHLRNNALGESISRILQFAGAEVYKVSIINNRGVHICKSMLAYQKFHSADAKKGIEDTPDSLNLKSDRFVGDCYVEFEQYRKENEEKAEKEVHEMLVQWENGDKEIHALWERMNDWAISGIRQTYKRTGIHFDQFYFESETYLKGKDEVLNGLQKGIFYREEDGSGWVDLAEVNLDKKVLLRRDGTSLYITQDIGTAIFRHADWPFNELIYVVGNEQNYHFIVLFHILKKLGFQWAKKLHHLSYGMVNLPEGKMKSREGTVVDADDLIDHLQNEVKKEIASKERVDAVGDVDAVSEDIALGALHYFLLQATPSKDMLFNPKESLSFSGNTGPYLQYMGARICSILRKAEGMLQIDDIPIDTSLLTHDIEWELIKHLGNFSEIVEKSALNKNPAEIASFLYTLAKLFSTFYHDCPILSCESKELMTARLHLVRSTKIVLKTAMHLILIPFLERM